MLLEADANCVIVGFPLLSSRFQLKLKVLAPSVSPGKVILLMLPDGDTKLPEESNVSVPVLFVGVPVVSPAGKATE